MFEYEKELKNLTKTKTNGIILNASVTNEQTSLWKIKQEIEKYRELRTYIINLFEQDVITTIRKTSFKYLKDVPYPILIDNKKLFIDNELAIKVFTKELVYENCLFSKEKIEKGDRDCFELALIYAEVNPYVRGLFNVLKESNLLNNSFYDDLEVMLDNENIKKLIINGEGIRLPIEEFYKLNMQDKNELLKFYYNNLKKILKNIMIFETKELNNYRSNISKKKVLELYRG